MLKLILVVVLALAGAAFVAANWAAFTVPTLLTLGVVDFAAPLGLLMLFVLIAVTLALLTMMALWQGRILAESRRHSRELAAQRALAEQEEASRLTAVRTALERRLDALETALRGEIGDGVNSLAAMVAELDDRVQRGS
jgi:hypothetical protein